MNSNDPTGTTCTRPLGKDYDCKIDFVLVKATRDNPLGRRPATSEDHAKYAAYEKSYTAAVNKLAANPNRTAPVTFKADGRTISFTLNAGDVARTMAGRKTAADPSDLIQKRNRDGSLGSVAVTTGRVSFIGSLGLKGTSHADRMDTAVHEEGIHGSYVEAASGFLPNSDDNNGRAHTDAYSKAIAELLK